MQSTNYFIGRPEVTATIAVFQALVLYVLYLAVNENWVLAKFPEYLNSLAGFAFAFPLIFLFIRRNLNPKHIFFISLSASLVIALCGYYAGLQSKPIDKLSTTGITWVYVICSLIIAFKTVIYAQIYLAKKAYTFGNLYKNSWRTFIVGAEAWIFTWLVFGILFLGAGLFKIVGINLFNDLLEEFFITIPIFTLSFSFAVSYFQSSQKVADTIATVLQSIIKFVLPLVVIIIIGFALSLVFTGIGPLWGDGPGSSLILWLQALALFFVNTVYMGTQKKIPYKPWLHKVILVGIAFMPIYSVLATYGLWLRIDQYGLTPARGFGMMVNLLISLFSFSYFLAIVKVKTSWFLIKNKINVVLSVVVVIVCILLNTPLLSMQVWSTHSQMARLDMSEPLSNSDMRFFRNNLGASGYKSLEAIRSQMRVLDVSYDERFRKVFVNYSYSKNAHSKTENQGMDRSYKTVPENIPIPDGIIEATFDDKYKGKGAIFIQKDLNNDEIYEYISLIDMSFGKRVFIWTFNNGVWNQARANIVQASNNLDIDQFFVDPNLPLITVEEPKLMNLKIGEAIIYVPPKVSENTLVD